MANFALCDSKMLNDTNKGFMILTGQIGSDSGNLLYTAVCSRNLRYFFVGELTFTAQSQQGFFRTDINCRGIDSRGYQDRLLEIVTVDQLKFSPGFHH